MAFEGVVGAGARRRVDWTAVAVPALIVVAFAIHVTVPLPDDVAWLLTACERMIVGQRLYVDIAELNPPMSVWLYLPFVRLAQIVGASPDAVTACAATAFGLATILAAERILVAAGLIERPAAWRCVAILALLIAPVTTFAQRDHIAAMAALPMLAAIAARAAGSPSTFADRVLAGVAAGLAMSIKPHFAVAIALPALYALARRRSLGSVFTAEYIAAAAVVALYAAAMALAYPAYFTEMLPVAREVYLPNRLDLLTLLTTGDMMQAYVLVGAFAATRPAFLLRPLYLTLLLGAAGFVVAYLLQGKGWHYQALPALSLAMIVFGLSVLDREPYDGVILRAFARALAAFLVVAPAVEWRVWRDADAAMIETLTPFGPGLKIALMSDALPVASPLHRTLHATLVNRGPSLWMAGNALAQCRSDASRADLCARASAAERAAFLEDVTRNPPDVILTHAGAVDWLAWAREDPRLAAVLDGYAAMTTLPAYGVAVTVMRRKPA